MPTGRKTSTQTQTVNNKEVTSVRYLLMKSGTLHKDEVLVDLQNAHNISSSAGLNSDIPAKTNSLPFTKQ